MGLSSKAEEDAPVKVVICGAGPAGLMLAHCLLGLGNGKFHVSIYDKGEDPRVVVKQPLSYRRFSIGLSKRADNCLGLVPGLLERVKTVTMRGDHISVFFPLFQKPLISALKEEDAKHSWVVDRISLCSNLVSALLDTHSPPHTISSPSSSPSSSSSLSSSSASSASSFLKDNTSKSASGTPGGGQSRVNGRSRLELNFNCECTSVDLERQEAVFRRTTSNSDSGDAGAELQPIREKYDLLVGADGLRSVVRSAFQNQMRGFEVQQRQLPGEWVVTHFPCPPGYAPGTLHLFPLLLKSGGINGLAIPSPDGTLCLIWAWLINDDPSSWFACVTPDEAHSYIHSRLPFFNIPKEAAWKLRCTPPQTSMTVKCWRYHDTVGHAVLIGDAAHATAPSIGQGCNASLVDACVLSRLLLGEQVQPTNRAPDAAELEASRKEWSRDPWCEEIRVRIPLLLERFSALQVPEGHALVDLSNAAGPLAYLARVLHGLLFFMRSVLSNILPFLVSPPVISMAAITALSYTTIYDRFKTETDFFVWWNSRIWQKCERKKHEHALKKNI